MNRLRLILVCLLTLATAAVSLAAAQRAEAAVLALVTTGASTGTSTLAEAGQGDTLMRAVPSTKRCLRGALPGSPCGFDLAPPVRFVAPGYPQALASLVTFARDRSMSGLPPACLLGPPRTAQASSTPPPGTSP